ncbi:MAG: hypothetical protein KC931_18180 [Candidatus Omnitrophica bacterium]|nr:hypothetical protein [Candidatus Omnitrophota bacterium]
MVLTIGCDSALQKVRQPKSSSDQELKIATLAANEQRNRVAFYNLNYTNLPADDSFTGITLASGRLLSSDDGRFRFDQNSSEPSKNYSITFDPNGELSILFPSLKRAFRAPASILQSPESLSLLAAYDAMRILLGQAGIWADPTRSQFKLRRSGATVEQPGRPFKWNIDLDSDNLLLPINEMVAKAGVREVLTVDREALSYESLDYSSGGSKFPGKDVRGANVSVNTWRFLFPKASSTTEIQITPLNEQDGQQLVEEGKLDVPVIPDDYRTEQITLASLLNWLNIR